MAKGFEICEMILGTEALEEETNAPLPILVRVEGNSTFERLLSHRNAHSPIDSTPSGMMTDWRLEQFSKA